MSIWRSFAELWPKGASEGLRQTPPSLQAPASYIALQHFSKEDADQFDLSIMKFSVQFLRVLIQAPRSPLKKLMFKIPDVPGWSQSTEAS